MSASRRPGSSAPVVQFVHSVRCSGCWNFVLSGTMSWSGWHVMSVTVVVVMVVVRSDAFGSFLLPRVITPFCRFYYSPAGFLISFLLFSLRCAFSFSRAMIWPRRFRRCGELSDSSFGRCFTRSARHPQCCCLAPAHAVQSHQRASWECGGMVW